MSHVNVKILDEEYRLKIKEDSTEEYITSVAEYVDRLMMNIEKNTGERSPKKIAILAALNIADEYLKQREVFRKRLNEIGGSLNKLDSSLELK